VVVPADSTRKHFRFLSKRIDTARPAHLQEGTRQVVLAWLLSVKMGCYGPFIRTRSLWSSLTSGRVMVRWPRCVRRGRMGGWSSGWFRVGKQVDWRGRWVGCTCDAKGMMDGRERRVCNRNVQRVKTWKVICLRVLTASLNVIAQLACSRQLPCDVTTKQLKLSSESVNRRLAVSTIL